MGMQTTRTLIVIALQLLLSLGIHGQSRALEQELERLNVTSALFVPSTAVDEKPIWSPDSRYLGVNIMGQWYKFDTQRSPLQEATWHNERIGALAEKPTLSRVDEKTIKNWTVTSRNSEDYLSTDDGVEFRFVHSELSSALTVRLKGGKSKRLWKSDIESCYELAISPNNHFLAFICEQNGVFVLSIPRLLNAQMNDAVAE